MPRKNTMRDNVNAVRSQLPHLLDLPREQIELALLYYESNVEETINAFQKNGAIEALSGWTEMNNGRGNTSSKRMNNKPRNTNNRPSNTSLQISPSNGILRPSQRVTNLFQIFAEGGTPTTTTSDTPTTFSPSLSSTDNNLNHDSTITTDDVFIDEQPKPQRRRSVKSRHGSTTQTHEPSTRTTVTKSLPSNNKKLLTKSVKDLQRQTSTLTNVEVLFDNEIKSSLKRIDDTFKQLREIIKEREIELYLQMDKVKEQGLNVIHRRQQRAIELRQRIDRCDRLEPFEIDNLRTDIKQFVTDRRYDLGEELTSSHRFEYDQALIESLKNFGHVLTIDRRCSVTTLTPFTETNASTEQTIADVIPENIQTSVTNDRTPSVTNDRTPSVTNDRTPSVINDRTPSGTSDRTPSVTNDRTPSVSNETVLTDNKQSNGIPITSDNPQHFYPLTQTNGYSQYYDDTNYYQNFNHRRSQQHFQRPRPALNYYNGNNHRNGSKQVNGRVNTYNNSETTNTYRRPRPPPPASRSIIPIQT